MKNENGMPGHSTIKKLSFEGIASLNVFPKRPEVIMDEDKNIILNIDTEVYGGIPQDDFSWKQFAFHRLYDFALALNTAELQLIDILEENPFLPEDFGFDLIHKPELISDSPIRLYESRFSPGLTIHRPIDPLDGNHDNSIWTITTKKEDGSFNTTNVKLPCHRIAYAVFFALGIQMEEEDGPGEESAPVITKANANSKTNMFDVLFYPKGSEGKPKKPYVINQVPAFTEKDAIAAAKFIVETDHENYEAVVPTDFDQYSATKN